MMASEFMAVIGLFTTLLSSMWTMLANVTVVSDPVHPLSLLDVGISFISALAVVKIVQRLRTGSAENMPEVNLEIEDEEL